MNADLHTFVRDALARGVSRAEIEQALRDARWPADEIAAELAAWADAPAIGLPVPRRRVGVSAREAFLYLLMFVALYLVAFHVGAILYAFIENRFPDAAMDDGRFEQGREWVRFAVATLLVAFPVFLFTSRLTGRAVARDPEKRNSGVRRWLTYLTLFVAACVLIGDFIAVLLGVLKGELGARFMLKAGVVAAIAGFLFTHYLGGLKRDEDDAPRAAAPSWLARVSGVAVLAVTVLGMVIAGAPASVRREALDQRRVNELFTLSNDIIGFRETQGRAPESLSELLARQPGVTATHIQDPVTHAPYEYRVVDSLTFELCATFDRPDSTSPWRGQSTVFWRHGAGRTCYTFAFRRNAPPLPR